MYSYHSLSIKDDGKMISDVDYRPMNPTEIAYLAHECGIPEPWCDEIESHGKGTHDPIVKIIRRLEQVFTAEIYRQRTAP